MDEEVLSGVSRDAEVGSHIRVMGDIVEEEVQLGVSGDVGIGICVHVGGGIAEEEVRRRFFRGSVGWIIVATELAEVDGAG
jgi:hypothetical protein